LEEHRKWNKNKGRTKGSKPKESRTGKKSRGKKRDRRAKEKEEKRKGRTKWPSIKCDNRKQDKQKGK